MPGVPTRLMATAVGQTQIDLYWIAPASNAGLAVTGYRIEVSSNGGVSWTDLVSNTNSDATVYSHTGLSAGATRTYRVSGISSTGVGNASGTAFATTAPARVMGLMVEPGDMQLVVNWTAVDNTTGYKVQWKSGVQDYNTGDRQATVTSGSTTTYTIPNLTNGTEYTVQVIATRTDANDGPPSAEAQETPAEPMETELSLAPTNPTVNETDGTIVLTVTLSPASSGTVTVDYATSDITADAGMDYTATSGTLTFMPSETSKTIPIPILNDTVYELTERFEASLSNPTGAALSSSASLANVNISSDDAVPTASMENVIVNEDAGTMTLALALSHESTVAVTYETTGSAVSGTATRPSDYLNFLQGAFTTITVPAGDMSATFDITIVDDMVNESDETIVIQWTLSPGINATPASFTFIGTITDNDGTGVSVSKTALTVAEEDTTGGSYTVVLNTQPTANVTVTVAGHAGSDVTPSPTTLTFTRMNWDTAQTVTVKAGNDADTTNDTVSLTHSATSSDSNYNGITIANVTVTVNDNVTRPPPPGGGGGGGARLNRSAEFADGATTDRSIAENTPAGANIGDPVAASDREDDTLTYSLRGSDADSFDINPATGQLLTKAPLDYEAQADYSVIVSVSDGKSSSGGASKSNDDDITVTINIENVDEPGLVALFLSEPDVGGALTAALTDPDRGVERVVWSWERSADQTAWTAISGASSAAYTPVVADKGSYLRATASYTDGHGPRKSARAATSAPVPSNAAPVFPDAHSGKLELSVAENTNAGEAVGAPVAATDAEDDALTYALGGADEALFVIDAGTGQITVGSGTALDYEADKKVYEVTVTALDSSGASETVAVTITVINVDLGRYDADGNEAIDRDEAVAAVVDYFADRITKEEAIEVLQLYSAG